MHVLSEFITIGNRLIGVGLESETHFYLRYKKKPTSNILVCADHHVREDNADFRVDAKGIGYEKYANIVQWFTVLSMSICRFVLPE